jgi:hypothetical protein
MREGVLFDPVFFFNFLLCLASCFDWCLFQASIQGTQAAKHDENYERARGNGRTECRRLIVLCEETHGKDGLA